MLVCTLFLHDLLLHLQLCKHASALLRIWLLKIWPVLGPLLQGALFLVPILQTHLTMQLLVAILMCSNQLSSSLIAHRMPSQFFLTKGSTLLLCRTTPALPASALAIHMGNSPSFTPGRPALLKASNAIPHSTTRSSLTSGPCPVGKIGNLDLSSSAFSDASSTLACDPQEGSGAASSTIHCSPSVNIPLTQARHACQQQQMPTTELLDYFSFGTFARAPPAQSGYCATAPLELHPLPIRENFSAAMKRMHADLQALLQHGEDLGIDSDPIRIAHAYNANFGSCFTHDVHSADANFATCSDHLVAPSAGVDSSSLCNIAHSRLVPQRALNSFDGIDPNGSDAIVGRPVKRHRFR